MSNHNLPYLMSGNTIYPLFQSVIQNMGYLSGSGRVIKKEVISCETKIFSNENIKIRIDTSVRGKDVFLVQPVYPNLNERVMELFIILDALKHASAGRVTVVLPYFPYVRSDKKDEARISITARLMADLLETAGADRVLTMSLHSPQIQGFFRIPIDHLLPEKIIVRGLKEHYKKQESIIVAPDTGAAKSAKGLAAMMGLPLAIINKRRVDDSENPVLGEVIGNVENKKCLMYDDEICSGGSMFKASELLIDKGAVSVDACAVHGVLAGNVFEKLKKSKLRKLYITDTIFCPEATLSDKIQIISVSEMFEDAIRAIHKNTSMTRVFERGY